MGCVEVVLCVGLHIRNDVLSNAWKYCALMKGWKEMNRMMEESTKLLGIGSYLAKFYALNQYANYFIVIKDEENCVMHACEERVPDFVYTNTESPIWVSHRSEAFEVKVEMDLWDFVRAIQTIFYCEDSYNVGDVQWAIFRVEK